jgi:hypothetical protein
MASSRTPIALALAATCVLALLPRPALRPVTALNAPLTFLLAPIQEPPRHLSVWLRGASKESSSATPEIDPVKWNSMIRDLLAAQQATDDLRALVKDLSRGVELNPELFVRQIAAPVIGFGTDLSGGLVTVRAGRREGVEANAVVVVRGVYLVGRVLRADERTCAIVPITEPSFPKMFKNQKFSGVIMLDEQRRGPRWQLASISDGKLVGKVYDIDSDAESATPESPGDRPEIKVGMLVRLRDEMWPASAQMLEIGRVERVDPGSHGRLIVTIRPEHDLSHIGEVMIRVPESGAPQPATSGNPLPLPGPNTPAAPKEKRKP